MYRSAKPSKFRCPMDEDATILKPVDPAVLAATVASMIR
jgi:hypothetical protein